MDKKQIDAYLNQYRDELLDNVMPFWLDHSVDNEKGGFIFCLDRKGERIDTDKSVWIHGRFVWLLATLCATVEQRTQWLDMAAHGLDFIEKYCIDPEDGRAYFIVTRDGKPLRKRRYLYSEFFIAVAYAAYARATADKKVAQKALDMFKLIFRYLDEDLLPPKVFPSTRKMRTLGMPMMAICTGQELRHVSDDPIIELKINQAIDEIEKYFVNDKYKCVLENVGLDGEFIDHFDGRIITPGHGIECGWFILHEAMLRDNDQSLIELGTKIIDYCWDIGWDTEYGGIIYFRDAKGLPCTEYWQDMKFWWQQNEAIIATLLAYHLTGDKKYAEQHKMAHDWAYKYMPDPEYGEWFGYLHRDGRISTTLKGNMWKGPFHLPRMLWYCWKLLEDMKQKK
ncbi:MAG: AGE family epimerase/isomerase [Planctomycetota bacterium]|jgi:N-acylglucosamine 2-epimerase